MNLFASLVRSAKAVLPTLQNDLQDRMDQLPEEDWSDYREDIESLESDISRADRESSASSLSELVAAVGPVLEEVESEIDQRKSSGNDEYWQGLAEKAERLSKALSRCRVACRLE
jgi:hypothetical protein